MHLLVGVSGPLFTVTGTRVGATHTRFTNPHTRTPRMRHQALSHHPSLVPLSADYHHPTSHQPRVSRVGCVCVWGGAAPVCS